MDQELTPEQLDAVARASVGGPYEINYALTGDPQWLPDKSEVATTESRKNKAMSPERLHVDVDFRLSAYEFARLKFGHILGIMEDKWFAYFDEDESKICLHRSWTGNCWFQGKIKEIFYKEYAITEVVINDAERQYHGASIEESLALFCALVARYADIPSRAYWERWLKEQRERR